jgi:outer membrane protein insertion porin family
MERYVAGIRSLTVRLPLQSIFLFFALLSPTVLGAQLQTLQPAKQPGDDLVISGPYRVGKITFVGHHRTRESTLRRAMAIQEGDIFDLSRVRRGIQRLQSLVEIEDEQQISMEPDPITRRIDLEIQVVERDVFFPEAGGGYSQVDGWSGHASLGARNAFGFGETFSLAVRQGLVQDSFRLSATSFGLFGTSFDGAVHGFDESLNFRFPDRSIERSRSGFALRLRRPLNASSTKSRSELVFGYQNSSIEDRSGAAVFQPFGSAYSESALEVVWLFDSHDDLADPRSGARFSLGLLASGGALGGDVSALTPRFEAAATRTLSEQPAFSALVRGRFDARLIDPLDTTASGDPSISPLDRIYPGGPNSMRGFGNRSIWLRDRTTGASLRDANGTVLGGDASTQLNLELHLIPRGPVRFVVFADAVELYTDEPGLDTFGPRASAGLELQLRLPRIDVPLRLIWAENLTPLPGIERERFERFSIGFGLSF